jgi:two-component SAPR family response regulator
VQHREPAAHLQEWEQPNHEAERALCEQLHCTGLAQQASQVENCDKINDAKRYGTQALPL